MNDKYHQQAYRIENTVYCNNCGKEGHVFNQCKIPITSLGIVAFRWRQDAAVPEYLMIRRRDTLGYIDFMRGKYSTQNIDYIKNMLRQMTVQERRGLLERPFDDLWRELWGLGETPCRRQFQYNSEESHSRDKIARLKASGVLNAMVEDSIAEHPAWEEAEWGFPKGRRNYGEKDYDCAVREFVEETGYPADLLHNFQNVFPFEENFMGSNYKSYKHKYFLSYINFDESVEKRGVFQKEEVGEMAWKTLEECLSSIRDYNVEKKRMLQHIDYCIRTFSMCEIL
jgi:8-oxo-dGTP pyrophosphatase MutT (NUDIX family)